MASTQAPFVSALDERTLRRARDELGEDEKEREGAIQTLRDWALQQTWLKTPTDSAFLLRFLRVRKFSQLNARQSLENYWKSKTKYPEWFREASPTEPGIQAILDYGFIMVSPVLDDEGRTIILERPGSLKIKEIKKKYGLDVVIRTICTFLDCICMDERVQVNGSIVLIDASNTDSDLTQIYNPNNLKKMAPIFSKSMPARLKGINFYNINVIFETLITLAKSTVLPKKLAERVNVHPKSLLSVYEKIPKKCLPYEYLPDDYDGPHAGTLAEIIEYTKKRITNPEVVENIKKLNSGKYNVDLDQRKQDDAPSESFRKLNVQ